MPSSKQSILKDAFFSSQSEAREKKDLSPNIYNNIISNNNQLLAIQATTETLTLTLCQNSKTNYLKCEDCGQTYHMQIGCNKRTCIPCQAKRKIRLFKKYEPIIAQWQNNEEKQIQFLMLTHKNVHDIEIYEKSRRGKKLRDGGKEEIIKYSSRYVEKCDKQLKAFQKRLSRQGYLADYGFVNKEMTWTKENGYHYHNHVLFYGKKLDENNLRLMWKDVTGDSYVIGLKNVADFNDNKHSLNYLLKYVTTIEEHNEGIEAYYNSTKGVRYFNTFGKKYGKEMQPKKQKIICQECGGKIKILFTSQPKNSIDMDFKKIRRQQRTQMFEKKMSSEDINQKLNENILIRNKEENLFSKIKDVIDEDYNIDLIENVLDDEDIKYLLNVGRIYEQKSGTYRSI